MRLSARNNYVKFTDEIEAALSATRHVATAQRARSSSRTARSKRRSSSVSAASSPPRRGAAGKPVQLIVAEAYNHFEVIETLANPYGLLGRAALEQMGLATS